MEVTEQKSSTTTKAGLMLHSILPRPLGALLAPVLLIALLAGCSSATTDPEPSDSDTAPTIVGPTRTVGIDGNWRLLSAQDAAGDIDLLDSRITLLLTDDDSSGGRAPCNDYSLSWDYTTEYDGIGPGGGGSITVHDISRSAAACADPAPMKLEDRYLTALERVTTAGLRPTESGTLQLELGTPAKDIALSFENIVDTAIAPLVGTAWQLESVVIGTGENANVSPARGGLLAFDKNGVITGTAGCSDFSGSYRSSDGGEITTDISKIVSVECYVNVLEEQAQILAVLKGGFTTTIEENRLTLSSSSSDIGLIYRVQRP